MHLIFIAQNSLYYYEVILFISLMSQIDAQNNRQTTIFDEEDNFLNDQQPQNPSQEPLSCCKRYGKFIFLLIAAFFIVTITYFTYFVNIKGQNEDITKTISPILQIINNQQESQTLKKAETISTTQNQTKILELNETQRQSDFLRELPKQHVQQKLESKITSKQHNSTVYKPKQQKFQNKLKAQPSHQVSQINRKVPISQQLYEQRIYAGEIHYSRIPVQYWQHRILMLKAMGLNTLSVYVIWNYHEKEKGIFDYETENKNISKFLQLAVKHKMKVLLRPGPYICGQWDLGGLPARLLGIDTLKIRTYNLDYLEEVQIYFRSLAPLIKPFLKVNNGPIQLVQIQNELGSFSSDKPYTLALVKLWSDLQIASQYYIEDSPQQAFKNYFSGAAIGISGGTKHQDFLQISKIKQVTNNTLVFGGQIYTGWMTHWGQKWGTNKYQKFKKQVEYLFKQSKQFSLYMAHGGTNFGLTAGANAQMHELSYQPTITSYDYDATITEQGRTTKKSDLIVSLMKQYVRPPSIPFPNPIQTISFNQIQPKITASLLANLGQPNLKELSQLYYFEHPKIGMYNQGIVVYQTYIGEGNYSLNVVVHDFALVFIDSQHIYTLARIKTDIFQCQLECQNQQCRILILVQAMGHNNYGKEQQLDIKGLLYYQIKLLRLWEDTIKINANWNLYKININQSLFTMNKVSKNATKYPTILKQTFNLSSVGDTYIDMSKYNKGYVWINGRNLGRYWKRGPQFRLYCPGVWLKKQNNQMVILQLLSQKQYSVSGKHHLQDPKK